MDEAHNWCCANALGVLLDLYVQPNAKVTQASGEHDGALKVRLHAPPIDGRANEALLAWVADRLGLTRRQVTLKSGHSSRRKRVQVELVGLAPERVVQALTRP